MTMKNPKEISQFNKDRLLAYFASIGNLEKVKMLLHEFNADPLRFSCACYRWSRENKHYDIANYLEMEILKRIPEDKFKVIINEL
ncbi:hypothetical protein OD350_28615 (plasmid) [Clostridium beijerinckii]|uniref:hypothetical protein n=1 Tax=Clostridium beijerinckii TaxID=1520 RepID=UPI0022264ADB|nr:hypothetical protein [Clostridium beijerinckii]UYZ39037.1 hypothetical protein OD350_28615 [Clostridium beijerinckii]